jgi:type II restriction enzyme
MHSRYNLCHSVLDRKTFRKFAPEIAWETEVWIAESPDHLIHFDGEKFLGPYKH